MGKPVKTSATFEKQIEKICEKGFVVTDKKECESFLQEANYYRLSAYFLPFRITDKTYEKGIPFSRIQRIYCFDQQLRNIVFPVIERIEFYLRTQFSYFHGHKYGSLGYLNAENFSDKHNGSAFQDKVDSCIKENEKTLVVRHHTIDYDRKFPIWVIIEFFSMGMLSYFYGDMRTQDKKCLAKELFGTTYRNLDSWLRCLTDLRNKCAHYSRLYFWRFSAIPKEISRIVEDDRSLFAQMFVLKELYPSKSDWNHVFLVRLEALIEEYTEVISLDHIVFPANWLEILTK